MSLNHKDYPLRNGSPFEAANPTMLDTNRSVVSSAERIGFKRRESVLQHIQTPKPHIFLCVNHWMFIAPPYVTPSERESLYRFCNHLNRRNRLTKERKQRER